MAEHEKKVVQKPESTEEVASPSIGKDLRTESKVLDALDSSERGAEIAAYFGIGGETPIQPLSEIKQSEALLNELRTASKEGTDLTDLFGKIAEHADNSMIDPNALRALMYRKPTK